MTQAALTVGLQLTFSQPPPSRPQALHSLVDIKLSYLEGSTPGFKITFTFVENEFFTNAELEKTYYYRSEVGYGGDLSESSSSLLLRVSS